MTPRVVAVALVVVGLVVVVIAAGVTYLIAIGRDPDPMLRLTAQVATAAGSLATLVLQLVGRRTVAKVERNVGALAYREECGCGGLSSPYAADQTRPIARRPRHRGEE